MASANPGISSTNLFRRLAWQSSIPLEIRLAEGEPGAGSDYDRYYMHAPRHTYLPLLIPEIRENFVGIVLNDQEIIDTDERNWWFEEEADPEPGSFISQGACRWHWPLDLIELHSVLSRPDSSSSSASSSLPRARSLRLLLHLSSPPTDKLMMSNSVEACKTQFINQVKEADFVRWRSTSKVTGLRRADLEAGWDGIIQDDYDLFMRMASKVLPSPPFIASPAISSTSAVPTNPPNTDPGGSAVKPESSYSVRAVPVKLYLPDGAPVLQDIISPHSADGKPLTVLGMLRRHLPLLFPPTSTETYPIAFPIASGIDLPPHAEVAWLAACICGADGWLRIGVRLRGQS
ncbi:MAG: autophagy protein 5 [Tremellales sp. Tagirdzhanova-0007]|nr:MAG: autophagy protein 5 [Tremellales sp. Tagirdzhanova-0007]